MLRGKVLAKGYGDVYFHSPESGSCDRGVGEVHPANSNFFYDVQNDSMKRSIYSEETKMY